MDQPDHGHAGLNPPSGASFNYYLKNTPPGEVKIAILDEQGRIIRTLPGTKEAGLKRVWWDLRHESPGRPRLRTSPLHAPHIKLGPEGWRPLPGGGGPISYRAAPGTYVVKLMADGEEFIRKLMVKKDPNSEGSEINIRAQGTLLSDLRDMSNSVADMINQIEWVRKQITDLREIQKDDKAAAPISAQGREFDEQLMAVEGELIELRLTGGSQDWLRWPARF